MHRVYLNGKLLPPDQAWVSAFDRGFIFGDGVYEVIPVYGGRPFRLKRHLQRLAQSLDSVRIRNPLAYHDWESVCAQLIAENGGGELSLYLQVTRGVAPRDHAFPNVEPTVFGYAQPLKTPDHAQIAQGGTAIIVDDIRWARCDIKAVALLANVLLRQQAVEQGATESILIRDDQVTEGAASNIFIVKDARVITPPQGRLILPGVTRDLVLELARSAGVDVAEASISKAELLGADEVWMTSSTKEIFPLIRVDGIRIGTGRPGPMHANMHGLYQRYKQAFRAGEVE